jgi:hypothetical protein
MFARIFAVASLVAFALADGQCNTSNIQCCESSTTVCESIFRSRVRWLTNGSQVAKYNAASGIMGLAAIVADVTAVVGLSCSPVSVVGTGAGCEANQEPLCCSNNEYVRLFMTVLLLFNNDRALERLCEHWLHSHQRHPLVDTQHTLGGQLIDMGLESRSFDIDTHRPSRTILVHHNNTLTV